MLRIHQCECGHKMRFSESSLGRKGKCKACGRSIALTEENSPVDEKDQRTPAPPPASSSGVSQDDRRFGFDAIMASFNQALDPRKLVFAVVVGLLYLGGARLIAYGRGKAMADLSGSESAGMITAIIAACSLAWAAGCLGVAIGGVARAVHLEVGQGEQPRWSETWRFVAQRGFGLFLISIALAACAGLGFKGVDLAIAGCLKIPTVGPVIAGLSTSIVFALYFLLICLGVQVLMMPCIMAVEQCGATGAVGRLLRLLPKRGGRILAYETVSVAVLIPITIVVLAIGTYSLVAATSDCSASRRSASWMETLTGPFLGGGGGAPSDFSSGGFSSGGFSSGGFDRSSFNDPSEPPENQFAIKANQWLVGAASTVVATGFLAFILVSLTASLTAAYQVVRQTE